MKRIVATLLLCAVLCSFFGCTSKVSDGKEDNTTEESFKVSDFTVYTENGEKVSLYKKLGKPVIINFWATWCPPCKAEMPAFEELYSEYGDEVEFMMINVTDGKRDTPSAVKAFISRNGYTFPVYCDNDMSASTVYGVQSIPMTVFVYPDGTLSDYHIGAISEDALRAAIEKMLEK